MIHLAAALPAPDTGDTAWVLVSAALVLLMTPGLAFFYGGMVRGKNVLGMLMQNYVAIGVVSVLWVLVVYSLAFGKSGFGGFAGNLHQWGLGHMNEPVVGGVGATIPPLAFVAFQLMFAVITPALITGSTADRFKFSSYVVFIGLWVVLVYAPIAHWVFSPEGWLFQKGAEDFAGGTVVHANAGAAGIAMAILLGRRKGWPKERMRPHNVPYVLLGAGLLWFGWFGFNAGSSLGANNLAGYAFVNTNTATAAALLGWLIVEKLRDGHATTLGAASGAVAGLVAITPAAGFVSPVGAIFLGLIAGAVCSSCTTIKFKLGLDDALDVGAVHLVGGVLGALLIGFFGTTKTGVGANGIFYGGGGHLLKLQAEAVGAAVGYSFVATMIIGFILKHTIGIRMSDEQQMVGMDESLHAESAYDFNALSAGSFSGSSFATSSVLSSTLGHRTEVQA
ncbi:MAG TPA: ammonium transporter [Mycobacteriales bacterium]|jgi:Amt family ammonium transporter|nr:ammonium transporter [Mycobacteriales bacterium]